MQDLGDFFQPIVGDMAKRLPPPKPTASLVSNEAPNVQLVLPHKSKKGSNSNSSNMNSTYRKGQLAENAVSAVMSARHAIAEGPVLAVDLKAPILRRLCDISLHHRCLLSTSVLLTSSSQSTSSSGSVGTLSSSLVSTPASTIVASSAASSPLSPGTTSLLKSAQETCLQCEEGFRRLLEAFPGDKDNITHIKNALHNVPRKAYGVIMLYSVTEDVYDMWHMAA